VVRRVLTATRAGSPARPDCLIIGAAKAGTTSLFNVLAAHPAIAPSTVKETRFFSRDDHFARGLAWYYDTYFRAAPPAAARLEASPAYLTWSDKVAPRIRATVGASSAKFVVILRDPTARAYSHYWHRVRLGHEALPFAEAIRQEPDRLGANWEELSRTGNGRYGYVRAGCYATRLAPFLERFDRRQFHFLLQEDLGPERFAGAIRALLAFLEIDEDVRLERATLNGPATPRHRGLARVYWRMKKTRVARLYPKAVPAAVRRRIVPALFSTAGYPPIDSGVERELRARFADEVRACQALIQRDLSSWLPRE
jgi:hypothetical protein